MPIDAGGQPLHKRNPYEHLPLQSVVHGVYTAEDVIYMHAYLLGVPGVAFEPQHWGRVSSRDIVKAFERIVPQDVGIQQVKALIALTNATKQWARGSYGIDL